MRRFLPPAYLRLADACPFPLYVVGGSVRDFLAGERLGKDADWDLASPASEDEFLAAAEACGMEVRAVYRNTGTVKLADADGFRYEFTRFRRDVYRGGEHRPSEVAFTADAETDARRRDFRANAVYYDAKRDAFLDPLGGREDIARRVLRTVAPAEKVFGEDGLRLMRLARIAAQTGFAPDADCIAGAKRNAALVRDVAPERIFAELVLLLHADEKRGDADAPYRGLCLLRETGVLAEVVPELALGDGMAQRPDFHAHDVLEHSLRCVRYAPPAIRFAALLHDVGKPFCKLRDGNFHAHAEEGARIAADVLTRLKAPKKLIRETAALVAAHMHDLDGTMRESKVRREIVLAAPYLDDLLALRQADFEASKDVRAPAPNVVKWKNIRAAMRAEGAPLSLRELAVSGRELQENGVEPAHTAEVLNALLLWCAEDGRRNERDALLARAAALSRAPRP